MLTAVSAQNGVSNEHEEETLPASVDGQISLALNAPATRKERRSMCRGSIVPLLSCRMCSLVVLQGGVGKSEVRREKARKARKSPFMVRAAVRTAAHSMRK